MDFLRVPDRYFEIVLSFGRLPSLPVIGAYLFMCAVGHVWTKLSKPFPLRMFLVVHNFICGVLSCVATLAYIYGCYDAGSIFSKKDNKYIKYGCLVYLISKYIELLDTVFMILRHSSRQISFLHVYHHSSILFVADYAYQNAPWPIGAVMFGLNSFVHIFLYFYYAQSALAPKQRPWWKKAMTKLQIGQFLIALVYVTAGYAKFGFCIYSILYVTSMLVLFSHFYYVAYMKRKERSKQNGKLE